MEVGEQVVELTTIIYCDLIKSIPERFIMDVEAGFILIWDLTADDLVWEWRLLGLLEDAGSIAKGLGSCLLW